MPFDPANFGRGTVDRNPGYFTSSAETKARILGWAGSCPVVEQLIAERGAEAMIGRYGQVNAFFQIITREMNKHNPALAKQMTHSVSRKDGEPAGKYEARSVPPAHETTIAPMGRLPGYASTRLLIEQWGINDDSLSDEELQERIKNGRDILHSAIEQSHTPIQFLAHLAEGAISADTASEIVLKNVFPSAWVEEHSGFSTIVELQQSVAEHAPRVWEAYQQMPDEQKDSLGIYR